MFWPRVIWVEKATFIRSRYKRPLEASCSAIQRIGDETRMMLRSLWLPVESVSDTHELIRFLGTASFGLYIFLGVFLSKSSKYIPETVL